MYLTLDDRKLLTRFEDATLDLKVELTPRELKEVHWLLRAYQSEAHILDKIIEEIAFITFADGSRVGHTDDNRWVPLDADDVPVLNREGTNYLIFPTIVDAHLAATLQMANENLRHGEDN